jgi:murein L,D-transpeptidase YcbB/YkuD
MARSRRDEDQQRHQQPEGRPASAAKDDGSPGGVSRRGLVGGAAAASLAVGTSSALAQEQWWERAIRESRPTPRARPKPRQSKPDMNDLRTGPVPWRSDEMLMAMDKAIERFERIAANSRNWPTIPKGRLLRRGEYDSRIPIVRQRLVMSGDLPVRIARANMNSLEYDGELDAAMRRFQENHGLRVTGFLNRSTRAQLNIPAEKRLQQLRINRERIARLLNMRVEDRYVLVNVPAFQLEAVERFEVQQRHRVIAGKPDRRTPEIQAQILGLNFFPYWRVPRSIAVKDLVPRVIKEPDYLEKERIRPVEGHFNGPLIDPATIDWHNVDHDRIKFRQDPGEWNALGLVRVNMPNKEIVYLHDTPMKDLFKQRYRAFSAGCVRVQDVMKLAAWLLRYQPDYGDTADVAVQQILDAREPVDIELTQPVPVYFTYITAWAEPNGKIEFRPDVYGRDGADELRGEPDPDDPPAPITLSP